MQGETEPNGFAGALRRIEACAASGSDTLDLRGLRLTELPGELSKLSWLTQLDLGYNSIGDEGARMLGELKALTTLKLYGNSIGDEGARALGELKALTTLDLRGNSIGAEGARALGELKALTSLNLGVNNIGAEGARALGELKALTSLNLDDNSIGDEGARALGELKALTTLNLYNNSIGDEGARALGELKALTTLDLWNNSIEDEGARALGELKALTSLDLHSNSIGDEGARALGELKALTTLILGVNSIGDEGARALGELKALTTLILTNNSIGDEGARALGKLKALTTLYLGGNSIGDEGARALGELKALTTLNLINNSIGDEGARALGELKALTTLDLSSNRIGAEGARALGELKALTSLDLPNNSIGDEGACALGELKALTTLDLRGNNIGDEGARALGELKALTTLNLSGNNIGDGGARALGELKALTSLDLGSNSIGDVSPLMALVSLEKLDLSGNAIKDACEALWFMPSLREVNLHEATLGDVPRELLSQNFRDNCLSRLRAHFRDSASGASEIVRDVKVMVLGNGRIGKTQICRRLVGWDALGLSNEAEEFELTAISTHGVQVRRALLAGDESPTPLQIWDFGGQDLYLGTHALFLRTRAIFPIIWTPESEREPAHIYAGIVSKNFPLAYWVEYVAQMAGRERPVILIQNQCDGPRDRVKTPDVKADLLDSFDFQRSLAYSAKTKRGHAGLIEALQQAVVHVHDAEGLPRIGGGRAFVKRKLEEMRDRAQTAREAGRADPALGPIDKAAFAALCEDRACVAAGGVSDQDALLYYLHQIGTIFYQPPLFDGRIIVDQQWALEAIYVVFERESGVYKHIRNIRGGRFTRSELARYLWDGLGHGEAEQDLFLDMMRSCRIAFPLREPVSSGAEAEYLAPDLLPPKAEVERRIEWDERATSKPAVFRYDLLPPGLLRTIMAEIGEKAGVAATYWDNGIYFYERHTRSRAIIEQVRDNEGWAGSIEIRTQSGDAETLLQALAELVRDNQNKLGIGFAEPKPYQKEEGFLSRVGELLGQGPSREARRKLELAAETRARLERPKPSPRDDERRTALDPGPEPLAQKACYLSYAWGSSGVDATAEDRQREKAADELCKAAEKKGVKVVRDRDVLRFGDSLINFMNQLTQAQRIYIILSAKYLRSPFCMFELYSIWNESRRKGEAFRERISVLRLPDAAISRFEHRFAIAEWWADEHERQKAMVKKAPNLVSQYDFAAFKLTGEFASHVGDILALVADTLHPTSIDNIDDFSF